MQAVTFDDAIGDIMLPDQEQNLQKNDQAQWRAYRNRTHRNHHSRFLDFLLAHQTSNSDDLNEVERELMNVLSGMKGANTDQSYLEVIGYANILCRPESGCLGVRGYWQELCQLLEIAVEAASLTEKVREEGVLSSNLAVALLRLGKLDQAEQQARKALSKFEQAQEKNGQAKARGVLATIARLRGEYDKGKHELEELLVIFSALDDQASLGVTYTQLGRIAEKMGDAKSAGEFFEQDLKIEKALGDDRGIALASWGLGNSAYMQGDLETASGFYENALTLLKKVGDKANLVGLLGQQANLRRKINDLSGAEKLFWEVIKISEELGEVSTESIALFNLSGMYHQANNLPQAIALMERVVILEEAAGFADRKRSRKALAQLKLENGEV